jgi:hypothetical protein
MARLGNGRVTLLADATARLSLFVLERGPETAAPSWIPSFC